jgi:predicted site-specific integrase-resolvase
MTRLSIREAAQRLGVAEPTIRRRLRSGLIPGYQEDPPNGRWWVDLPDDENGLKTSESI